MITVKEIELIIYQLSSSHKENSRPKWLRFYQVSKEENNTNPTMTLQENTGGGNTSQANNLPNGERLNAFLFRSETRQGFHSHPFYSILY